MSMNNTIIYMHIVLHSFWIITIFSLKTPKSSMIFEKGERRRTERTTSEHFPKRAKISAFLCRVNIIKAVSECWIFCWFLWKANVVVLFVLQTSISQKAQKRQRFGTAFIIFARHNNKEKALTNCKCFFWNSAATYSPGPCPAKYHLRRKA